MPQLNKRSPKNLRTLLSAAALNQSFTVMAKIKALIDSIKTPQLTGLPLIAINLLKFHKEANWLIKAYKDRSHYLILKSLNNKKSVHIHSECNPAHTVGAYVGENT